MPGGNLTTNRLLYIVNVDWFFMSHRLAIAKAARAAGYEVHIACGVTDREDALTREGFIVHPLRLSRGSWGMAKQIGALVDIFDVISTVRPGIVHLVTIKPVLIGGIAARILRVPKVIAAISGLGYIFIATGFSASVRRSMIGLLYRLALGSRRVRAIFQNADDRKLITGLSGLDASQVRMIRGSGVDLNQFRATPLPEGRFTVVLAARLLIDKGIREFVHAAEMARDHGLDAAFVVAGDNDPDNPACIPPAEIEAWRAAGLVEFPGRVDDMAALYRRAHIAALPSYREGMPLALLEAAACGRGVVTTDVPGCREAIEPGVTGVLVPVRDGQALGEAIIALIRDPARCAELGRAGRDLAERAFDVERVIATHLDIYAEPVS